MDAGKARTKGASLPGHVEVHEPARTSRWKSLTFQFVLLGCVFRRCHRGAYPVEQPFVETNQASQVSERLSYNAKSTWSAEWLSYEPGFRSEVNHSGAWPGSGLGCPALCRPHLKQC
eukprot:4382163-Amphidinium_carterae.1